MHEIWIFLFRATQSRYDEISRQCHAKETQICKTLHFFSDIYSILYLQGGCEKSSWQNAPASQAEEAPTSTLGICHTSLLPFCCSRHRNKSTTLGVQTRPTLSPQNKRFKEYSFDILNPMISKQWRGLWEKRLKVLQKQTAAAMMIAKMKTKTKLWLVSS